MWQEGWQTWEALPGVTLEVFCRPAHTPGPVALITAGIHGDEYEGPAAVIELTRHFTSQPGRGMVLALPVANPPAFQAGTRLNPEDGRNLARCFPGNRDGSPTERLAAAVFTALAEPADYLIDLHSGGVEYLFVPLAGFYGEASLVNPSFAAAQRFGLPYLWQLPATAGVLSYEMAQRLKVAIGNEYLGAGQLSAAGARAYCDGALACLAQWGFREAPLLPPPASVVLTGDWLLAETTGLFHAHCALGQRVTAGALLATITDERGAVREMFTAQQAGLIAALRSKAHIRSGNWALLVAKETHV